MPLPPDGTPPSPPPAADERTVARLVRAEQVALIYRQAVPFVVVSPLVAAITCAALWGTAPARLLGGWLAAVVLVSIVRLGVVLRYRAAAPADRDDPRWERRFVATVALAGLAWGVGGLLVMPADSMAHQFVVYAFLMGMCSGTAAIYAAHAESVALSIFLILAPSTAYFAVQDDAVHHWMAFAALIFIASAARATRMLNEFLGRSYRLAHELDDARRAADLLARTDALTGLRNRRAFYDDGEALLPADAEASRGHAVVMLDVDHFKAINDRHGHAGGDEVLRVLGEAISSLVPANAVVGRLGGEEFAVLLPGVDAEAARATAEALREHVRTLRPSYDGAEIALTASAGVAAFATDGTTLDELLARADRALYAAKQAGRDRVVVAEESGRTAPTGRDRRRARRRRLSPARAEESRVDEGLLAHRIAETED